MKEKLGLRDIMKISSISSGLVLIFSIIVLVSGKVFVELQKNADYTSLLYRKNFVYTLEYICIYFVTLPLLIVLFHFIRGKKINSSLRSYLKKPERSFAWCAKWSIIAIGTSQGLNMLFRNAVSLIKSVIGQTSEVSLPPVKYNAYGLTAMFIVSCICAPILEEIFFRGSIFVCNREMGDGFAIIICGLMFGLWHMNYGQFMLAFCFGVGFSFMTLKTKSLYPSIICHFINNLMSNTLTIASLKLYDVTGSYAPHSVVTKYLYKNDFALFVPYIITKLSVDVFIILGVILLIRELIKQRNRRTIQSLSKGNFSVSPAKARLAYFLCPVTLVTLALLTYITFAV